MHAAGIPPIITVGVPGGSMGPPTCGGGITTGHKCISETLAANGILILRFIIYNLNLYA
jgi:hypothetical protein